MKCILRVFVLAGFLFSISFSIVAQGTANDSIKFDFQKIAAFCLDGDVKSALSLFETDSTKKISDRNLKFKTAFENRFKYAEDKSNYLSQRKSSINNLLFIYHHYWRVSLLDKNTNYDTLLVSDLHDFFGRYYFPGTTHVFTEDSIDKYLKKYIEVNNLHTTGFGKTGKLYDLLVWKTEQDTVYSFSLGKEKLTPRVVFMDDFITLGWEEYATLDRLYPGGWTTADGLYCVKKAYDLNSENFLVSYLAHEGRHFADTKLFPKLKSPDLEYRAKLVELSLANKSLYSLIDFFINNANYDSQNGHSVADYCVIRDISKILFNTAFERDKTKWEATSVEKINQAARQVLEANTKALRRKGKNVESYIK